MEVANVFPTLLPVDVDFRIYEGFINVKGESYALRIQLPQSYKRGGANSLKGTIIDCDPRLSQLLSDYLDVIMLRLTLSNNLPAFLLEFKAIVENCLSASSGIHQQVLGLPPKFFSQIVEEIADIGWERLTYVDPSFSSLQLTVQDADSRNHPLTVHFDASYPAVSPRCTVDLPAAFEIRWSAKGGCLRDVYRQFAQTLKLYLDFWRLMDEIDSTVWVLEPEKPNRGAVLRRIAISGSASVQIEVDALNPRALPSVQLLGAAQAISPLREQLNQNLDKWNIHESILDNLTMLLGVEFPRKATTKENDLFVACGICYAWRLNDATPVEVCANEQCKQPFHRICLNEWLRTLSSSRVSYNVLFGSCPYCGKPISVKMVDD